MVVVEQGAYFLGCKADVNRECFDDEKPARSAELPRFSIMRHEVTVARYQRCVSAGACVTPKQQEGCSFQQKGKAHHPVNCVSWSEADAYCRYRKMRLPSEAQWEAAALGKAHRDFPWGSDPPSCVRTVMFDGKPGCGSGGTMAVGSRSADVSAAGARDMGGNVREWTASKYAAYPDGTADPDSEGMVNRGGSFMLDVTQFNTSHTRRADPPSTRRVDLGFRCVSDG